MKKIFFVPLSLFILLIVFSALKPVLAEEQNVKIFCDNNYPPYSFVENGKVTGIYTDIFLKAFSKMQGYEITITPIPWKRGLALMEQGKGFALYPPYYRPKLRPFMDYAVPVLDEGLDVLCTEEVAKKNLKNWPDDFSGMRIGINAGFSIPENEKAKALNIIIEEAKDNRSNLLKLASGRLDGYINNKNSMLWELKRLKYKGEYNENKHKKLVITTNISNEQGYMGFTNQGKGKFAFKQDFIKQFVKVINQMKKDGEIEEILQSYIR